MNKLLIYALGVLVLGIALSIFLNKRITSTKESSYVERCTQILFQEWKDYILCCKNKNEIYECNRTKFKPGEFIDVEVNIQKLNRYFDTYYACVFSDFPISSSNLPENYMRVETNFACFGPLNQSNQHHAGIAGYVIDKLGEYTLLKIWLFPGEYPKNFDFFSNVDKGIVIFNLRGVVG